MDEFQTECLIILVVITFGTEVFVTVAWHVLLEETSQVFQTFGLVLLEVTAHNDDAPVGEVTSSIAVLPEADVAVKSRSRMSTQKPLAFCITLQLFLCPNFSQVEIEIKN